MAANTGKDTRQEIISWPVADPWAGLAAAIILQAAQDARAGDLSAASWLVETAPDLLDLLGLDIHPDYMRRWVMAGCPKRKKGGRYVRA